MTIRAPTALIAAGSANLIDPPVIVCAILSPAEGGRTRRAASKVLYDAGMAARVVVITGASSGIGAALAEFLANKSMSVVLVARRADALQAVAARCGGRAHVVTADVTRRTEVRRAVDEALARFGRIDVWVNNAGRGITRAPSELTDDDVDEMMRSNVKSALYGIQEVLPHFKSRHDGHVINVSSMLGRMPFATIRSAYCGAKHFLNALTATLRDELAQSHPGIAISLVSPGVVRTDFGLNAVHGGPDSRQFPESQSAEEVAAVIADVIDSRAPDVYTRKGAQARVAAYYANVGADPQP
jgi:NADP-dependent 3-hydroxy acid dehydrogenase YdfG